jgi:hypothetical protein
MSTFFAGHQSILVYSSTGPGTELPPGSASQILLIPPDAGIEASELVLGSVCRSQLNSLQ